MGGMVNGGAHDGFDGGVATDTMAASDPVESRDLQ